jgi:hypothetical protein
MIASEIAFDQAKPGMILTQYDGNLRQHYWIVDRRDSIKIWGTEFIADDAEKLFQTPITFEVTVGTWNSFLEKAELADSNEMRFAVRVLFNAEKLKEDW